MKYAGHFFPPTKLKLNKNFYFICKSLSVIYSIMSVLVRGMTVERPDAPHQCIHSYEQTQIQNKCGYMQKISLNTHRLQ